MSQSSCRCTIQLKLLLALSVESHSWQSRMRIRQGVTRYINKDVHLLTLNENAYPKFHTKWTLLSLLSEPELWSRKSKQSRVALWVKGWGCPHFFVWNQLHNLIFVKLSLLQVFGRRNDSLRARRYYEAPPRFLIISAVWQQLFKQRPFWSCPWFYMCSSNYEWGGLRSIQNHQAFYSLLLL